MDSNGRKIRRRWSDQPSPFMTWQQSQQYANPNFGNIAESPSKSDRFQMSDLSVLLSDYPYMKDGKVCQNSPAAGRDVEMLSPNSQSPSRYVEPMSVSDISNCDNQSDFSDFQSPVRSHRYESNHGNLSGIPTTQFWSTIKTEPDLDQHSMPGTISSGYPCDEDADNRSSFSGLSKTTKGDFSSAQSVASSGYSSRKSEWGTATDYQTEEDTEQLNNNTTKSDDTSLTRKLQSTQRVEQTTSSNKAGKRRCCGCMSVLNSLFLFVILGAVVMIGQEKMQSYISCSDDNLKLNISALEADLQEHVYGQHIAVPTVVRSITELLTNPKKNVTVLSFQGWTGIGKNYISSFIAKRVDSDNIHKILVPMDFAHITDKLAARTRMFSMIVEKIPKCRLTLLIIDEIDKGSEEVVEGLTDAIRNLTSSQLSNTKIIIVVLSNNGGSAINRYFLQQLQYGRSRDSITRQEIVKVLLEQNSNEWYVQLHEEGLLDSVVPFLPLEKEHVHLCAVRYISDTRPMLGRVEKEDIASRAVEQMSFFPPDYRLFSATGCRGINFKVDLTID